MGCPDVLSSVAGCVTLPLSKALVTGVLGLSLLQVISVCISGGAFSDQCMVECLFFKVTVYV